jgi:hypothetical protein
MSADVTSGQGLNIPGLKRALASFLATNGVKPRSYAGRKLIHAFWYGAVVQSGADAPAGIAICLLTGRIEELVEMGEGK